MTPLSSSAATHQPYTFQAQWTEKNQHLQSSTGEKIKQFFLGFINNLCRRTVLPSSSLSNTQRQIAHENFHMFWHGKVSYPMQDLLRASYSPTSCTLTTPDGTELNATYFRHNEADETSDTVICFQPNAALSKMQAFQWLMKESLLKDKKTNFVIFDYRGCGESKGKAQSAKDLIQDADTVYQFVQNKLHVPPHKIHLYGWSLGGGISAELKALHPEHTGKYVNERSFKSLSKLCKTLTPSTKFNRLAVNLLKFFGWNIKANRRIDSWAGEKKIVYHPQDPVIKTAGLAQYLQGKDLARHKEIMNLQDSIPIPFGERINHHCHPLVAYVSPPLSPKKEIADFLF